MPVAPIDFAPSQYWDGNDGSWSTYAIQIGTPAQSFLVLPSTTGQETWVPIPEGCIQRDPKECPQLRGAFTAPFQSNASSTWKELGISELLLDKELGYQGSGLYGLDVLSLQIPNSMSRGAQLKSQVIAGIATKDFYLGSLGLGPKPVNFSGLNHPIPSFMQSLKDEDKIPSLSYGYTAGASYRSPTAFRSLTLGGYDETRFLRNSIKYPFDSDDSRPLSIFVESISTSDSLQGRIVLSNDEQKPYAVVDSTTSHLWLPRETCDRFESAFGLLYDPSTDLYRINDTERNSLHAKSITITIGVGLNLSPLNRTTVVLPYKAFDLEASHPIYPNATRYFPIRRAANSSQYRLGRVILQEAYLIADYERSQFSIHQARFDTPTPKPQLVSILPLDPQGNLTNSTNANTPFKTTLGKGAIAGIAVGSCAALAISFIGLLIFIIRRRRRQCRLQKSGILDQACQVHYGISELHQRTKEPPELQSEPVYEMYQLPQEVDGTEPSSRMSSVAEGEPAAAGTGLERADSERVVLE